MKEHSFKVGETVHFTPGVFAEAAPQGKYRIVRQLPADGTDNQYRIMSIIDGRERVVRESQLA